MRKPHTLVLLLVLSCSILLGIMAAPAVVPMPSHPAQTTCHIETANRYGSGVPVFVNDLGYTVVLTAKHVVDGEPIDQMVVRCGDLVEKVVRVDLHPDLDIAALWVPARLPALRVDDRPCLFGERLLAAGWIGGHSLTLSEGLVSTSGHLSVDIVPGCSGGPVIREGRVVGILIECITAPSPYGGVPIGALAVFVEISAAQEWVSGILR